MVEGCSDITTQCTNKVVSKSEQRRNTKSARRDIKIYRVNCYRHEIIAPRLIAQYGYLTLVS